MNHEYSDDDQRYLDRFESFQINPAEFHHREHLRIAYVLIIKYGVEDALRRIRSDILGFLDHLGAGDGKYHETITYAWLLVVHHFMQISGRANNFEAFIQKNDMLLDPSILNSHYSKTLLASGEAKKHYIKPDLDPIPVYDLKPG